MLIKSTEPLNPKFTGFGNRLWNALWFSLFVYICHQLQ